MQQFSAHQRTRETPSPALRHHNHNGHLPSLAPMPDGGDWDSLGRRSWFFSLFSPTAETQTRQWSLWRLNEDQGACADTSLSGIGQCILQLAD